jgi:hypothetical protein
MTNRDRACRIAGTPAAWLVAAALSGAAAGGIALAEDNHPAPSGPAATAPAPAEQGQTIVRVLPPQGELVATPQFSGVGEPALVRGEDLEPGKSYQLNWTRVVGNQMGASGRAFQWNQRSCCNPDETSASHRRYRHKSREV